MEDAGTIETPGDSEGESETRTSGGVSDDEGAHRTVTENVDCEITTDVGLVPGRFLRQMIQDQEVSLHIVVDDQV